MRTRTLVTALVTALVAPLALAACGSNDNAAQTAATPTAAATMPMDGAAMPMAKGAMPMAQAGGMARMAEGQGTVAAVDDKAGTIAIEHGPIAAVNWPAMTMVFQADPAQRKQVAAGDKVAFTFRLTDGGAQITSIARK